MNWEVDGITRRAALTRGFGGVGALALVCSFDRDKVARISGKKTSAYVRSARSAPFDPFQRDLPIPPVATPTARSKKLDQYVITMKEGTADILPGYETPILGFNGLYPGPTIKARRGRETQVRQINRGGRELNVHLHGGITEQQSDGYPHDVIAEGDERVYSYSNVARASTLWYHDHAKGQTHLTLFAGLAGFYILEDPDEDQFDLPRGKYDVPLMIQDRAFNSDGSFRYRFDLDRGFRGDTILINGAVAPRMKVERRIYRLRFLNASNARPYKLVLGNDRKMIQIGSDGGLLPGKPVVRTSIPMEPAERVDVLVDFRQFGVGSKVILRNAIGEASTTAMMRFDVVRGGAEEARIPKKLVEEDELPPVNAERSWPLTFQGLAGGGSVWQIAGGGFSEMRIDARPRLGSTELWSWINLSERTHPMHMHSSHFRVVSVDGKPPHPGDAGWKDTVAVYPKQTVVVRPYFDYYTGLYVFHCHASEHGDMSMMGQMEVVA
ncbi:MAG TPA: multicopper oxidase domain-containing protein [Solirubrobacter sp.]|nr:multicopper oxidase domain-containing protein [Solirubrobacter sp.]